MLVLTRKIGEKIIIGDNIFLTIIDIKGDQVQLGLDAPREISIHREEVFLEIQEENKRAQASKDFDIDTIDKLLEEKKRRDTKTDEKKVQKRKDRVDRSDNKKID